MTNVTGAVLDSADLRVWVGSAKVKVDQATVQTARVRRIEASMIRAAGRLFCAAVAGTLIATLALPVGVRAASNCFGLSASDCRLVAAASANINKETSFQFALDLSLKTSGAGQGASTVTAKGNGALAFDTQALQNSLSGPTSTDLTNALKGTVHLDLSSQTTNSGGAFGAQSTTSAGQVEFVVLDGTAYSRTTGANNQFGDWQAAPLGGQQGATTAISQNSPAAAFLQDPNVLMSLAAIPSIKGFISAKRIAQAPTLEGQSQAAFVYTFDQNALFTSSAITPLIKALIASGSGADPASITDSQAAQAGRALAQALSGTTLTITAWVGTTDRLYHALILDGNFQLDTSLLGGPSGQTASIVVHLGLTLTKVGQPVVVTAPIAPPAPDAGIAAIAPIASDDAVIPETALTRFAGIPTGLSSVDQVSVSFPYLGSPDAPVKVTQLSSYSCSFCRDYYDEVFVNLLPAIRAGQVQYIFVPVTLTGEYNPTNETAAVWCALDQGKFWEMQDVLFNWRSRYDDAAADAHRLTLAAIKLGLNIDKFTACVTNNKIVQRIQAGNDYFNALSLNSTPSILINGKAVDPIPSLNDLYQSIVDATAQARPDITGGTPTPTGQ
ncbi:MAG: DsbA family protein [Aggregatilineales bacterium]